MITFLQSSAQPIGYANDFDTDDRAWVPELWAAETLALLEENMVAGQLVHTDFEDEVADFGDVVNTRKPGEFEAENKGTDDDVTVQDATAVKIPVKLDQHVHVSFMIRDSEESKSFADLVEQYLRPAAQAMARRIDKMVLGQAYQFLSNSAGQLESISDTVAKAYILGARETMNKNNAYPMGRNLIVAPGSETECLKLDIFITADKVGDEGTALREASLGRKLGFDFYMGQNTPSVLSAAYTEHADELASDAAAGATTVVTDDGTNFAVGDYITFWNGTTALDTVPYRVIGISTNTLTLNRAVRVALPAATTDIRVYTTGLVDLAGHTGVTAYPAGYDKRIKVDGTGVPNEGQLVSFNTDGSPNVTIAGEYSITSVIIDGSDYYIKLDRPLDVAITDNDVVGYGPAGDYNFAFHRNAVALVVRPLAMPRRGTGAIAGVSQYNGLAMRVVITYLGKSQGHLVTLDMLCGVKVLDTDLGAVMLG